MSNKEFIIELLVPVLVFIAVMSIIILFFIAALKFIRCLRCVDALEDLESIINRMSRDANVKKQYIDDLNECYSILKRMNP